MLRIALLAVIAVCLYAGPADAHYPIQPEPKGGHTLESLHVKLHVHKGHAARCMKHCRTATERRWHRLAWHRIQRRLAKVHFQMRAENDPRVAICQVFGPYCDQALAVASCETGGTFATNARNGQYLGLFQMGDYARARYGHSSTALGQARAAYRYFVDSGRDWSPWECKP